MLSSNSKMLTAKENYGTVDDLVQYISLHKPNHILLSGSILPFIFLYLIWLYVWIFIYGIENYNELLFISILIIAIIHILVCLCCFWSVHIHTFLNCRKYKLPKNATIAKVCPTKNNGWPELLKIHATKLNDDDSALSPSPNSKEESVMYWFLFQKTKYIWNPEKNQFYALEFPIYKLYNDYRQWKGYQTEKDIQYETKYYGNNQMIMAVPEFLELFKERATAPFFIFQIFSVGLWCLDDYWYYSLFTLFMLVVFECTLVQQQLRNMAEIRKMGNKPYLINTYRFNKWRPIMTDSLIPGDLISICRSQNEQLVPCDVLLLRGSCIVDESMLTGESVPQIKESLENSDEPKKQLDIESDGKLFCLFGGTKVVQHTAPNKSGIRGPDDGCVAYVLRNGFNTSQGKLLRTILFGVKRVTENNLETFIFLLFLLIFAVAAASYVWIKGTEDPERNRYKLFLECTLIITSIIPPDLPIELTLAVNTSLLKLTKLYVYCTEPFRIPIAGKLQICCFDKTGTLTSDDLMVEGIAGLTDDHLHITNINEIPENTVQVLATCHTLVQLDDGLVGDPLEKATLLAIDWNLTKQDSVIPKRGKYKPLKIYHRFYFSSALKRMSVIAGHLMPFSNDVHYIGTVKGAPEVIMNMLKTVPENYEKTYLEYARRGARVLALGMKDIGKCDAQTMRDFKREDIESDLIFVGFVIISCPLKPDSKSVIKEIIRASHKVVMITGDNPLTACFVAKELRFTRKTLILLTQKIKSIKYNDNNDHDTKNIPEWSWISITDDINIDINEKDYKNIIKDYDLAITGEGLKFLSEYKHDYFLKIIPYISVYARFAPKQKELVITTLKALGYFTLMCGDGTNDVGALKHAHIGVSILSKPPSFTKRIDNGEGKTLRADGRNLTPSNQMHLKNRGAISERPANLPANVRHRHRDHNNPQTTPQDMLMKAMKDIEDDQMQIVKLGDASIAAPFTSKLSSIMCVCHIIKQGRCTLVTTLQMFKILALNALISAYCQSVLYVDGVKFSDTQATLQGLFIAACFLFITRSKPLKILSKEAPLPNIFNAYTFLTILLQFSVHFGSLIYLTNEAEARSPPREGKIKLNIDLLPDEKEEFVPNFVNSTIYIMCMALQVSTFIVNHKGHPFMESLRENRFLMYTIVITGSVVGLLSFGISSELLTTFEIIEFPNDFKKILVTVLIGDIVLAYAVDRMCSFIFGSIRKHSDLVNN